MVYPPADGTDFTGAHNAAVPSSKESAWTILYLQATIPSPLTKVVHYAILERQSQNKIADTDTSVAPRAL
jgi:hypothetical protein